MDREKDNGDSVEGLWLPIPTGAGTGLETGASPRGKLDVWALVLTARGIPFRVEHRREESQLFVPADFLGTAVSELSLFEEENRDWPPVPPPAAPLAENTLAALSVLLLLALFHNLILLGVWLPGKPPPDWVGLGSASSERILEGQWWRLITALTLHANYLHLLGNLTIGGIFIVYVCRYLGSGLGWTLLLAAGTLGNLENALLQPVDHDSLGASTLVFGAVGVLAALEIMGRRHLPWKQLLLPLAGAVALLALLGTEGERTDLGAHLCGFVTGVVLGLISGHFVRRFGRPGCLPNRLLFACAALVVIGAWLAALGWAHGG